MRLRKVSAMTRIGIMAKNVGMRTEIVESALDRHGFYAVLVMHYWRRSMPCAKLLRLSIASRTVMTLVNATRLVVRSRLCRPIHPTPLTLPMHRFPLTHLIRQWW